MSTEHGPQSAAAHLQVVDYQLNAEEHFDGQGYLRVRRVHLQNRRSDGSLSRPYFCELVDRPRHGTDAVVVCLWQRREDGQIWVLLRQGLRPALYFGREPSRLPIPDAARYLYFTELVAGILEEHDLGEAGIRSRAAIEAMEEAGLHIDPAQIEFLGSKVFPTPGMAPECFHLVAAEVAPQQAAPPPGDGSPMEEGSRQQWVTLDEALARCEQGQIEDAKTELGLRRLAARRQK